MTDKPSIFIISHINPVMSTFYPNISSQGSICLSFARRNVFVEFADSTNHISNPTLGQ